MNLRYWIHPGWFRLIDWWRAEQARVAEAEEEWFVETTDLWSQRKPERFGFADIRRDPVSFNYTQIQAPPPDPSDGRSIT